MCGLYCEVITAETSFQFHLFTFGLSGVTSPPLISLIQLRQQAKLEARWPGVGDSGGRESEDAEDRQAGSHTASHAAGPCSGVGCSRKGGALLSFGQGGALAAATQLLFSPLSFPSTHLLSSNRLSPVFKVAGSLEELGTPEGTGAGHTLSSSCLWHLILAPSVRPGERLS